MNQRGIIGDNSFDLPVAEIPQDELKEERKMARYAKSAEFKRLREHMEERINFYQTQLPGTSIEGMSYSEMGMRWQVANSIIMELRMILDTYDQISEVVKNG